MCGPPPPSSSHRWGSATRYPAGVSVTVAPDVIVRGTRAAPGHSQLARVGGCLTGGVRGRSLPSPIDRGYRARRRPAGRRRARYPRSIGDGKERPRTPPVRQPPTRASWECPGAARVPRTITSGATVTDTPAGERFADPQRWEDEGGGGPHIWRTLGYRRTAWQPGRTSIEWDADPRYSFPTASGPVIQGGLVTALLDAAMGGACWTVLDHNQAFLTADLRVEFLQMTTPGLLSATGWVVRRTRRVVFCAADLQDVAGRLLASSRCTQVVRADDWGAGRYGAADPAGAPPRDARG